MVQINKIESKTNQAGNVRLKTQAYENNFSEPIDTTGLIALYQFNSDTWNSGNYLVNDTSGNSNTANIQSELDVFWQNFGVEGGAAYTDGGTNSYIVANSSSDWALSQGTIEMWFRVNEDSYPANGYLENMVYTTGPANDGHAIILNSDGSIKVAYKGFDSGFGYDSPAASYNLGEWTHIAFTFSSSGLHLFINGVELALTRDIVPDYGNSNAPVFGRKVPVSGSAAMKIFIDEIAIYNRELPLNEVLLRYNRFFRFFNYQIKVCQVQGCNGNGLFIGPDGKLATRYKQDTEIFNGNLIHKPSLTGRYFQVRTIFGARDSSSGLELENLKLHVNGL